MRIPFAVARRIRGAMLERLQPLLLLLDREYRVTDGFGDPGPYGYPRPQDGTDAREPWPFLFGMPLDEPTLLPFVETPNGRAVQVQLFPSATGAALLLTDATAARARQQEVQQHANEVKLLGHRQAQLLRQLEAAQAGLQERHRQAEEASRIKSRFIAGLSHELRTPLAAVLGELDALREAVGETPGMEPRLRGMEANTAHLIALIDNVLDQAQIESGRMVLNTGPVDLGRLAADLELMFTPLARQRGLALEIERQGPLPGRVELDLVRLRQVIVNLVNNALKFTPRGFVRLTLNWRDGRLWVAVADTGPGIPEQARQRIFHAFHQEPAGRDSTTKGVGLGLSIGSRLVRLMGGELRVGARPGGGSRFHFAIPAPELADEKKADGATVLIADDGEDLRLLLGRFLSKDGHRLLYAGDGLETLQQAIERRPDAVLMDLYFGADDGAELTRELRSAGYPGAILILSASSQEEDRQRSLAAGCDDYLVKPVGKALLRQRVAQAVAGRRG